MKYGVDPLGRTTFTQSGSSAGGTPGQFGGTALVDREGRPKAIGNAFNMHPFNADTNSSKAFCGGTGAPDALCTWLAHDRLGRVISVEERSSSTVASERTRTCFGYDGHGNLTKLAAGVPETIACHVGGGWNASIPAHLTSTYGYDDFGLVISELHPFKGAGDLPTRYEYNARGLVVKAQSAKMSWRGAVHSYSYDGLGRPTQLDLTWTAPWPGSELLKRFAYDSVEGWSALPSSCGSLSNTKGRIAAQEDSFGRTWFSYDGHGRLLKETRLRHGAPQCGVSPDTTLHTQYTYSPNGNVLTIRYPHGRIVTYKYGSGAAVNRVTQVSATRFVGAGQTSATVPVLIDEVKWAPQGGLDSYRIVHPGNQSDSFVEYITSVDNAEAAVSSPCSYDFASSGSLSDLTGRLRMVRVSTNPLIGDVYRRVYEWKADQITKMHTCYLGGASPITEEFKYDPKLRLVEARQPTGTISSAGGAYGLRQYQYNRAGNRTLEVDEKVSWYYGYANYTRLAKKESLAAGSALSYQSDFDMDGRVSRTGSTTFQYGSGNGQQGGEGGLGLVYKSANVGGFTFEYLYDAQGRRRYKRWPDASAQEFFYSGGRLLAERQGYGSLNDDVVEDYIWLGGRPVVVVRGKFEDGSELRADDLGASCDFMGENAQCGFYFPVSGHVGRPAIILNSYGKIAAAFEHDPFGFPNRVSFPAETPHPYGTTNSSILAQISHPDPVAGMKLDLRVSVFESRTEQKCGDGRAVRIRSESTGQCLYNNPPNDGGYVHHWTCWGDPGMKYVLDPVPAEDVSATKKAYRLRHVNTNTCLYGNPVAGGIVHHWTCWADPNMVYYRVDLGEGRARFEHKVTGKCLRAEAVDGKELRNDACSIWAHNQVFLTDDVDPPPEPADYLFVARSNGSQFKADNVTPLWPSGGVPMKYGGNKAKVRTPWLLEADVAGQVHVKFHNTQCGAWGVVNGTCQCTSPNTGSQKSGAVVDGYEYRRYEDGAAPYKSPLGFPGQYFDEETDLFENWNRYYDPRSGRYLAADPLYTKTKSAYAYANNNPLAFVDPSGLEASVNPGWMRWFGYSGGGGGGGWNTLEAAAAASTAFNPIMSHAQIEQRFLRTGTTGFESAGQIEVSGYVEGLASNKQAIAGPHGDMARQICMQKPELCTCADGQTGQPCEWLKPEEPTIQWTIDDCNRSKGINLELCEVIYDNGGSMKRYGVCVAAVSALYTACVVGSLR